MGEVSNQSYLGFLAKMLVIVSREREQGAIQVKEMVKLFALAPSFY